MAYLNQGGSALEYFPCRYGRSKLLFRGPKRKIEGDYVAVIGGSETYGKFLARPYPALLEERLGLKVVNFGIVNGGLDVFGQDTTIQDACSRAKVTVIQISGAHNMSNRCYAVHPRRNDRFLRASPLLKTIYPDMDFTEFHFTRHLLSALKARSGEKFALVEHELREAWTSRMKALLSRIDTPVVLLWLSDHAADACDTCTADGPDPLFVDRDMMAAVAPYAAEIVEVVVGGKEIEAGQAGLAYGELEEAAAREMLGSIAHDMAAAALGPVVTRLSGAHR